jgi:hypothetical protein
MKNIRVNMSDHDVVWKMDNIETNIYNFKLTIFEILSYTVTVMIFT